MQELVRLYQMAEDRFWNGKLDRAQRLRFELIAAKAHCGDIQDLKDLLSALLADSEEHAVSN